MRNIFGEGELVSTDDLVGPIYCTSCSCMSVLSDFLSWANNPVNKDWITKDPAKAETIIVLSCQVTDLAILNDLKKVRELRNNYPQAEVYVGGCLALRFDIPLPERVWRLEHARVDYTHIDDRTLANFEKPFWVPNFEPAGKDIDEGHLFRYMYPLRIGVGCQHHCTYCTIKVTRGASYKLDPYKQTDEFLLHDNVVLIADSPSPDLLFKWICIAAMRCKQISIRNVEPQVVMEIFDDLIWLARKGLLKILHCPIQSSSEAILRDMGRDVKKTFQFMDQCSILRKLGVIVATNIIVDYKDFKESSKESELSHCSRLFDYVSWNPFWNGVWDEQKAQERFTKYIV